MYLFISLIISQLLTTFILEKIGVHEKYFGRNCFVYVLAYHFLFKLVVRVFICLFYTFFLFTLKVQRLRHQLSTNGAGSMTRLVISCFFILYCQLLFKVNFGQMIIICGCYLKNIKKFHKSVLCRSFGSHPSQADCTIILSARFLNYMLEDNFRAVN